MGILSMIPKGLNAVSSIMGLLNIGGKKKRSNQIEQQQKLTDMQIEAQKQLADYGMGISKQMFEYTSYGAQRRQMEEAGLNPALMYGHAGQGGSTMAIGAGNVTGGQASDETALKQAQIAQQGMALQLAKLSSEIAVNKAIAKEKEALAELNTEKKKGYWTELLNSTKNADSNAAKAAAMKLAAEWSTGEYTNWKTWVDIGKDAVNTIAKTIIPSQERSMRKRWTTVLCPSMIF